MHAASRTWIMTFCALSKYMDNAPSLSIVHGENPSIFREHRVLLVCHSSLAHLHFLAHTC